MIRIDISAEDTEHLHALQKHPHPFVRRKALALLLKSQNLPHNQIMQIIEICGNTLCAYLQGYKDKGIEFVTSINFYKPTCHLTSFEQQIKEYVEKTPPASIKQACSEIGKLTGVYLKETQMRQYLKTLGVDYRKVCGIPARADVFKETRLDPRLEEAKFGQRTVYFVDAAHFVLGAFLGYLWSLTRVFVRTPAGRQRFNVLGALNIMTKQLLMITNDTYITSVQVCELLRLIAADMSTPVTLVLDNARYQRCRLVTELAQQLGIELLFLPPYSPNLNIIERLWKFTKKNCLNSKYYDDFSMFKKSILTFLETMHTTHKSELDSLLTSKFQLFDAQKIKKAI